MDGVCLVTVGAAIGGGIHQVPISEIKRQKNLMNTFDKLDVI